MSGPSKTVNYLSNKDILQEIHKSKNTFTYYVSDEYKDYDLYLQNKKDFNAEAIEKARQNRLDRLNKAFYEKSVEKDKKKIDFLKLEDIKNEDIIIRINTLEHVPVEYRIKKTKAGNDRVVNLNFPPYKQYKLVNGNELQEVGRSHWVGGLENGYFSKDHGKITYKLANMFLMLVERYGQKGNWRGYCVDETTEALTTRGWLKYNEINNSDKILSYEKGDMKWSNIKSVYRGEFDGLMHKMTVKGMDSLVTPNHKFVTNKGLIPVEHLLESDKLILMGNAVDNQEEIYSNDFVELLGWILTEGSYDYYKNKELKAISIYQNEGPNADRIRNCLNNLGYNFSERKHKTSQKFYIFHNNSIEINKVIPDKNLNMNLILSLSTKQRELIIDTMIAGDGWITDKKHKRYTQKNKQHVDLFQALCAISGYRSNTHIRNELAFGKLSENYTINIFSNRHNVTKVENINFYGGKNKGKDHLGKGKEYHPNQPTEYYKGIVWCPETEYGCFFARRNGTVYLTGNTYIEDMKGNALVQLADVCLKFDESLYDNPFAYYTMIVRNCFRGVLNTEEKNSVIKNKLLMDNGFNPSHDTQITNSMMQQE